MNNFNDIQIIIMAGGVGCRFWPMSTPDYPKQFIDVMAVAVPSFNCQYRARDSRGIQEGVERASI